MNSVGEESRGGRIWGFPGACLWRLEEELVGIGLSMRESVMVSWQEGGKLEIRPQMGGPGLKLGGGTVGWD